MAVFSFGARRSMGFVSVIIVSALFAMGLPLVLLLALANCGCTAGRG